MISAVRSSFWDLVSRIWSVRSPTVREGTVPAAFVQPNVIVIHQALPDFVSSW
jgi:hypothetical protein